MPREIIVVGGLDDEPNRRDLLKALTDNVSSEVQWEWLPAELKSGYRLKGPLISSVFDRLGKRRAAKRRGEPLSPDVQVVKLHLLNGKSANDLYAVCNDPIPAPDNCTSSSDLFKWLLSSEAGLFPPREWIAQPIEAAIVAILCKLLKKNSIAGGHGSHCWTLEEHLLSEAPVIASQRPAVAAQARRILNSLEGVLLYSKGSSQGSTPKEWAISLKALPQIKRMLLNRSIQELRSVPGMDGLLKAIAEDDGPVYDLDEFVTERVRAECRENEHQ